ncbi:MAG: hypothetical protein AB1896_18190 [Thermodesulfobacteriota bacterium]
MSPPTDPEVQAVLTAKVRAWFTEKAGRLGREFYRLILYGDGRGEAEFQAANPVETLVFKWEDEGELAELLELMDRNGPLSEKGVVRKKCTKCLLHERPPSPGELR